MPPLYDDEAMTPLYGSGGGLEAPTVSIRRANKGVTWNRILIILVLVVVVIISIFFQMEQTQLSQSLQSDEEKIKLLRQTIDAQARVISRFNESVTNTDVLKHLKQLEANLEASEQELKANLKDTLKEVNEKLSQTMIDLDETVAKAESDITKEVETVKTDFERYVVKTQDQFSMENSFMVYQLAGTFTLLSCLISMWHMTAHLRKFKQPVIQRKILAILWMSPVYAITSWFSLVFHEAEGYLAIIKDGYEAYIIYQFLSFCISVLGKGDRQTVVDLLARRADHLTPPFRLFFCCKRDPYENDHALANAILLQCQFFAMQFVFFRPVTTIAKVFLDKCDYYGPWADSANDWKSFQFYVTLIQNLSIFIAFAGLLKFYHAVDKDLEWCRPFAKFLCIKGVVFMTFWQGLAITILAETTDVGGGDAEEWAMSAQNFLICLEMLLFSIAHFYCFPTEEWDEDYKANYNKSKFGDSLALQDFFADLKLIMKGTGSKSKRKKKEPSEPTVPEGDEENGEPEQDEPNLEEDDTTAVTSDHTVSSDIEETEAAIANALLADGGSEPSANPEAEEARRRIMASGFLSEMMFLSPSSNDRQASSTSYGSDGSAFIKVNESDSQSPIHYNGIDDSKTEEGEEPSTERTGLLSPSLRRSIFTTVAELAEEESTKQT